MPACGFCAVIAFVINGLRFVLTTLLRTDGILPCKVCDKYLKSQENYVKNIFFWPKMKKNKRQDDGRKKSVIFVGIYIIMKNIRARWRAAGACIMTGIF